MEIHPTFQRKIMLLLSFNQPNPGPIWDQVEADLQFCRRQFTDSSARNREDQHLGLPRPSWAKRIYINQIGAMH